MTIRAVARRHIKPLRRLPRRLRMAVHYYARVPGMITRWLVSSREVGNFTYDLTELNKEQLAAVVAVVTGVNVDRIKAYMAEPEAELVPSLRAAVAKYITWRTDIGNCYLDAEPILARRLGWYAVARAMKPKLIVETGVDHGVGAATLCAALKRNTEEGFPGTYLGTDLDPDAGSLFGAPWDQYGKILYGDSVESLRNIDGPIDLFINDSDHSDEYEYQEYQVIKDKLSERAIVCGDNSHSTDKLLKFSREQGRNFLYFQERPKDHWYPGGGIGFSYAEGAVASGGGTAS